MQIAGRLFRWLRAEGKPWQVGTLRYTNAALLILFGLLLLGDFSWSMRDRSVMPMAQWYLRHLQASGLLYGLLLSSFPALLSVTIAPIVSFQSDRYRSRWGRRIPFLLALTPLGALGMIGMGLTPLIVPPLHRYLGQKLGLASWGNETAIALVCFSVFWAAYELAYMASKPIFDGLVNDVVPAHLLGRFFGLFRAISLLDGIIFNLWIIGQVPSYFTLIFVAIGLFYGLSFLWMCLTVKEGEYPPPAVAAGGQNARRNFLRGCGTYFRECFSRSYYIAVYLFLMFATLSFIPLNTFSIPYAQSLGISLGTYGRFVTITFVLSFFLAYFLGWLSDIFHPLRTTLAAIILNAGVTCFGGLFATTPFNFEISWIMNGLVAGCFLSTVPSLGQRLFPRARFAQFTSASGILIALGTMLVAPLTGAIMDRPGSNYRSTFWAGFILALIALLPGSYVYRQFMKLGGPKNYLPPE